jgi:hypothetical protein
MRRLAVPHPGEGTLALSGARARFHCPARRPHLVTTVRRADLAGRPAGRRVFASGSLWELWDDAGEHVFRLTSPRFGSVPYKVARFDHRFRRGAIELHAGYQQYFPPGTPIQPFEYPLDELLLVHWLARGRGIELHACGIVDEDGAGLLFVGHSGAGKTTIARLWLEQDPRAVVLSDDRIVVRRRADGPWIHGTPWHGEAALASAAAVPLKAVFLLQQAPQVAVDPVPLAAGAATQLLARSFVPFHDADAVVRSITFIERVVRQVPCAQLRFARDHRFISAVRRFTPHRPRSDDVTM